MKICLVSDNLIGYHENWSGAEIICQYLGSLLEKKNQEVFYLTLHSGKKETPKNIVPITALNSRFLFFKNILPVHIIIRTISVFFVLKKNKPDVIHLLHSNSLFIPVMICAKILKIPTTFTVLDYYIICPRANFRQPCGEICRYKEGLPCLQCVSIFRFFERKIVRLLAKDLKQLITFTETSKKRLADHNIPEEKIKVKYIYEFKLGISVNNSEKKKDSVLFVGSFHQHKGLEIAIRAMDLVFKNIPNAKLVIIGKGNSEDTARIEELIKELGIKNNIEFLGQKKNEETLKEVLRNELVIVPEQWPSEFGPVILVETMALGRPVVGSKIGSIPEFIKDNENGFIAEHDNPEQFAEKIIYLLKNKNQAENLGEKSKDIFNNIFGGNQEDAMLKLYTDVEFNNHSIKKIGWIEVLSRRYGGVIYKEQVREMISSKYSNEIIKIVPKIFKKGYPKAFEAGLRLLMLKGKNDLWVRDINTIITMPFDRTKGKNLAIVYHIDFSINPAITKPLYFLLEKIIYHNLKKADSILTICEYWKQHFLNKGYKNVFKIYPGFDMSEFDISEEDVKSFKKQFNLDGKPIIYLGNCQKAKGVIESYEALKDIDAFFVTSGEQFVEIPAINLRLKYKDYLKLLKASTVALTMSKFKEGWCMTAHEAMLVKTPVIGSGLGGMRELLEGGKQIICEDFKDLKEKVELLLADSKKRKKMGQEGYNYAKDFTQERFKKDWLELISKVIYYNK